MTGGPNARLPGEARWLGVGPVTWKDQVGAMVTRILRLTAAPKPGEKPAVQYAVSGFAGGALGTSTSLNGVPVALTLSADTHDQRLVVRVQ